MSLSAKTLLAAVLLILASTSSSWAFDGTRGGGNTIKGRPVESYIQDPREFLPIYKKEIAPFVAELATKIPVLASEMNDIFEKTWYFVPVALDVLPSDVTGIDFPSDQTIQQEKEVVWVDSKGFNAMLPEDQRLLLIHELVMAAMLKSNHNFINDRLTEIVRKTTVYLSKNYKRPAKEILEALKKYDFPSYDEAVTSVETLGEILQNYSLPRYVASMSSRDEFGVTEGYRVNCEYKDIQYDSTKKSLSISIYEGTRGSWDGKRKDKIGPTTKYVISQTPKKMYYSSYHQQIAYVVATGPKALTNGDVGVVLIITIGKGSVFQLEAGAARCIDPNNSGECQWEGLTEQETKQKDLPQYRICGTDISR